MPIYQAWNPRTKAYVKYEFAKSGFKVVDVKQRKPKVPFKGIPIKGMHKNEKLPKKWIDMEMEHTTSRKKAEKIVMEHVKEYGWKYYPELEKITKRLKKK